MIRLSKQDFSFTGKEMFAKAHAEEAQKILDQMHSNLPKAQPIHESQPIHVSEPVVEPKKLEVKKYYIEFVKENFSENWAVNSG